MYVIGFMVANVFISNTLASQVAENGILSEMVESVGNLSYTFNLNNLYMYGIPFLVVIFLAMYFYLESENDGWKMIRISGGSIGRALFSKVLVTTGFIFYIFLCEMVVMLGYSRIDDVPLVDISVVCAFGLSFLGTLFNSLLVFLFFYLIDSVVVNITLGIVGMIVNSLLIQAEVGKYICTTYYYRILLGTETERFQMGIISVLGIIILLNIIQLCRIKHE